MFESTLQSPAETRRASFRQVRLLLHASAGDPTVAERLQGANSHLAEESLGLGIGQNLLVVLVHTQRSFIRVDKLHRLSLLFDHAFLLLLQIVGVDSGHCERHVAVDRSTRCTSTHATHRQAALHIDRRQHDQPFINGLCRQCQTTASNTGSHQLQTEGAKPLLDLLRAIATSTVLTMVRRVGKGEARTVYIDRRRRGAARVDVDVGIAFAVDVGVGVALAVDVGVGVAIALDIGLGVVSALDVGHRALLTADFGEGLTVAANIGLRLALAFHSSVRLALAPNRGVGVIATTDMGVGFAVALHSGVGRAFTVDVSVGCTLAANSSVGLALAVNLRVGLAATDHTRVGLAVAANMGVGCAVGTHRRVSLAVALDGGVGAVVAADGGVGLALAANARVGVAVAVNVGVGLGAAVDLGLGVVPALDGRISSAITRNLGVGLTVTADVGVGLALAVDVGVGLAVAANVSIGVGFADDVGVTVAFGVEIRISVGVLIPLLVIITIMLLVMLAGSALTTAAVGHVMLTNHARDIIQVVLIKRVEIHGMKAAEDLVATNGRGSGRGRGGRTFLAIQRRLGDIQLELAIRSALKLRVKATARMLGQHHNIKELDIKSKRRFVGAKEIRSQRYNAAVENERDIFIQHVSHKFSQEFSLFAFGHAGLVAGVFVIKRPHRNRTLYSRLLWSP